MSNEQDKVTTGLNAFSAILDWYNKYGFWGIIKGALLTIILIITATICYLIVHIAHHPEIIFNKYKAYAAETHMVELENRTEMDIQLKKLLPIYLSNYKSDRCWIISYHNGTLDWRHGTMRFELCKNNVSSIKDQYDNFNLTWLNLPYYLRDHDIFIGTSEELESIDKVLAQRFECNGVKYLACILIRNDLDIPIGIFGVTYSSVPDNINEFRNHISNLLHEHRGQIKMLIQMNK